MGQILDFEALKQGLIDLVQESQIKVGYTKNSVGLYYPLDSLNHLLGTEQTASEMEASLEQFCAYAKDPLGKVTVTRDDALFCLTISAEGAAYVHDNCGDNAFLRAFIERIGTHPCGLEDLLAVFRQYSGHVVCEKIDNEEFDYLVYFADGQPDSYRYCIRLEMGHAIYHRFTERDYNAFGF
ncbi:DUF3877 family protein [Butyricicoccus sp.]|uniref:DUF3877 family protein n=1 Tax=Butyricicoccus sp. TaxID=2049021 RepID=UPI003735A21F